MGNFTRALLRSCRPLTAGLTLASFVLGACGDDQAREDGTAASLETSETGSPGTTTASSSPTSPTSGSATEADGSTTDPDPQTTQASSDPVTTSDTSSGGPEPMPGFCENEPPLASTGLQFDGTNGVSMGLAPDLGLQVFTLEAWVRRDGRGEIASTGVGGRKLVPIISKGRGEHDGDNVDCNYAFGFYGDVLGADFEDMATGANHPVQSKTAVPLGSWHHVAATFDGMTWRLYLDGVLDGEAAAKAVPRHDSIQHFGLGTAFNSEGISAGGLHGALDEVRVYNRALEASEILATMYSTTPDPTGLVSHYRLDAADADARDLVGENPGTITGAVFSAPGAVTDRGVAPAVTNPRTDAAGDTTTLLVDTTDADGNELEVEFFVRELTAADDFTMVVMPDTQYYTRDASPPKRPKADDTEYFKAQTRWAWEHRYDKRVIGIFGVGDVVNNADQIKQWQRANSAMEILEDLSDPNFPDGMPYGVAFGNHDQFPNSEPDGTKTANSYFGNDRYSNRSYWGGTFDGDHDENFVYFKAGDLDIVLISFQFNETPEPEVLEWARSVLLAHPRALGMVSSHSIVSGGGDFSVQGKAIYQALKDVPNFQLTASGHVSKDARRTDEFEGNVVHSMLSDYQRSAPDPDDPNKPVVVAQGQTNGGQGYMRIWSFSPLEQKLHVTTYSPKKDKYYTDGRNKFTLDVDLVGAGGPFTSLGVVTPTDGTAQIELPDATAGKRFEWYAVARDCVHHTPVELQSLAP